MEKVDIEESKRLIRVMAGKEKELTRYEKKLLEVKAKFASKNENREFLFYYSVWTFIQNRNSPR